MTSSTVSILLLSSLRKLGVIVVFNNCFVKCRDLREERRRNATTITVNMTGTDR